MIRSHTAFPSQISFYQHQQQCTDTIPIRRKRGRELERALLGQQERERVRAKEGRTDVDMKQEGESWRKPVLAAMTCSLFWGRIHNVQ